MAFVVEHIVVFIIKAGSLSLNQCHVTLAAGANGVARTSDLEWRCAMGDLLDPGQEAADPRVDARRGGIAAAVTPGDDPGEDPALAFTLAHQGAATVTLAAVGTVTVREGASAQHAVAGVALTIALLALPAGKQRHPGLL